jgi:hypothetical protein
MNAMDDRPPVPTGWRLERATDARVLADGAVLIGGAPLRVLTLRPAGAALVRSWLAGAPVGENMAERRLARRLIDAGLANPDPPPGPGPEQVTVIVPVRDRAEQLRRCLASIDPRCPTVVVDDGSRDAAAIAARGRPQCWAARRVHAVRGLRGL